MTQDRREDVGASAQDSQVSLSEAQVRGLVRVMDDFGVAVRSVRVRMVDTGHGADEVLVTLDGGYGTYSFYLLDDGVERTAGMGESV